MDGFESTEPSPSYSPQASPEPAGGDGPAEATEQGPLVHEAIPAPAPSPLPAPAPAPALASQLTGGCSSGEAEAMAAPAAPAPTLPAAPAVDAADEAWKCSSCTYEHVGAEATFLTCKLCTLERKPTRKPPQARRQAAPQPTPRPPATDSRSDAATSNDDEDDAPLSRRAPAPAQPATPAAAQPPSTASKHKLPAASAADRPQAKKPRQSSSGAPAGNQAEEVEEQRYDESDGQLYPWSSFLQVYGDQGAALWAKAKPAQKPAERPVVAKRPAAVKQPPTSNAGRQGSGGAARKQPIQPSQPASSYTADEAVEGRWWADAGG